MLESIVGYRTTWKQKAQPTNLSLFRVVFGSACFWSFRDDRGLHLVCFSDMFFFFQWDVHV